MNLKWGVLSGILLLPGSVLEVSAHHAFSAEYDGNRQIEVSGVVTEFEWTNPHVRFYVDVADENGEVSNWDFELQSVNTLTRNGWTRHALQVGDVVTVVGFPAKDGSNRGNARGSVTKADGTVLFTGSGASDVGTEDFESR